MGLILFIVSLILKRILELPVYIYCSIIALSKREWLDYYNKSLAIATDHYGNGLCCYLFNQILIKKGSHQFGNIDETISSVIGKNKVAGTLTGLGRVVDKILDIIDPNHSIKSIDNSQN